MYTVLRIICSGINSEPDPICMYHVPSRVMEKDLAIIKNVLSTFIRSDNCNTKNASLHINVEMFLTTLIS